MWAIRRMFDKLLMGVVATGMPEAHSAAEVMWNARPHNLALARYLPNKDAAKLRAADMKSKAVYDSMDEKIQQLKDFQAALASRHTEKDSSPE